MFIRSIQVRSSSGIVHEYVRVVASVREKGRVKQKVVANLGRRDTLEAILPLLERFLRGDDQQEQLAKQLAQEGPIEVLDASTWGPMLVVRHFFAELGLWQILDAGRRWPRLLPDEDPDDDWPSRVLALIANRLTRPGSEHALGAWLESDYVCDRRGSSLCALLEAARARGDRSDAIAVLVSNPGSSAVEQGQDRGGALSTPARPVRLPARSGVLRSDEHLLRGSWSGRLRQARLQPGRQAPQRASRGGRGDGRRVADRPSRLGRQHARQQDGARGGRGLVEAFCLSPGGLRGRPRHGDREEPARFWRKPRASGAFSWA